MNWQKLTPYQPRTFVANDACLTDAATIVGYYQALEKRNITSVEQLKQWLNDRSELEAAVSQAGSIIYIDMTCHTDDPKKAGDYTHFVENVLPAIKPINDKLNKKFLTDYERFPFEQDRYAVYIKSLKTDIELFQEKNISLQTKVELLSQEYQQVTGAMTVNFQGKELTLPQMGKFQLDNDRQLRQQAWEASAKRRLADKDKLENLFEQMFALRNEIAKNSGFNSFIEYQYKAYHRFDYEPKDCKKYHEVVEKHIVPLYGQMVEQRKKEMGLSSLKPWDLAVDPLGRKALKPFDESKDLIAGTQKIFDNLDKTLAGDFKKMNDLGLLDLSSRKGKAPGGYQNTLSESRVPFIFMNAVGVDDDVRTLLHESGHAFHALAASQEPLLDYRHAPMEFCEVASMAMELLASKNLNAFYSVDDANRSNREHLEGIIHTLAWVATVDAFQHWLYERPQHSAVERRQAWLGFYQQFGGQFIDWQGYEEVRGYLWHRQLHVFEVPFYYIEYGIAQLGSLQLWRQSQIDFKKALTNYRKGLALGGSKPLPELYQAAGIKFDFSEETIKPLANEVFNAWKKMV